MTGKQKKMVLVGVLVAGGGVVWYLSRSKSTDTTATTNPGIVTPSGWSPTFSSDIYLNNPIPATTLTPILPVHIPESVTKRGTPADVFKAV